MTPQAYMLCIGIHYVYQCYISLALVDYRILLKQSIRQVYKIRLLGAIANLRKTISFFMYVSLSAWNISAASGWIFVKLDILAFIRKFIEEIQDSLQSDKNNRYFT